MTTLWPATRAQAQLTSALRWFGPHAHAAVEVLPLSARTGEGVAAFWEAMSRLRAAREATGEFPVRRREQDQAWMWERIEAGLRQRFRADPRVREAMPGLSEAVRTGQLPPSVAARRLLELSAEPDG